MARSLRIQQPGGRNHVTARGNERKPIYRQDTDRLHFLTLLSESTEGFGCANPRLHSDGQPFSSHVGNP